MTLIRIPIGAIVGVVRRVKNWKIIADNLSKAGLELGCVAAIDSSGRTIWIADNGKRFVVHADEKLTAFLELESVIGACGRIPLTGRRDFCESRRR